MRIGLLLITFLMSAFLLDAAVVSPGDSLVAVDVNYRFVDGVYTDITALRTNTPNYLLANLSGSLVLQEEEYLLKVEQLHPKGRADLTLAPQERKVICVKGLPYVFAYEDNERNFTVYAGLRVRGRLCYFTYDRTVPDTILIKAYNPLTGRPFRQQNVVRDKTATIEMVLDLASGKTYDFNLENMLMLLAEDEALVSSLNKLSAEEATARLQRCLLIFDDRHPYLLPATTIE